MKRVFFILISLMVIFTACSKDEERKINEIDESYIPDYSDAQDIVISENGNSYGFVFIDDSEKNYIYCLHVNEKNYGPFEYIWGPVFSDNDSAFGYMFDIDESTYFYFGNTNYGPYDNGAMMAVSPNGQHFGFNYYLSNEQYVRIDNDIFGPYDWFGEIKFFNDSGYSFLYQNEGVYYLNVNGNIAETADGLYDYSVTEDGEVFAYVYKNNGGYLLSVAGQSYGPYEEVWPPLFGNDGKNYGFVYKIGEEWFLNKDGVEYGPYDGISEWVLSDDGNHLAFIYRDGWQYFVFKDDETIGEYTAPSTLQFSDDGSQFGFLYLKSREAYAQIDNQVYGPYQGIGYRFMGDGSTKVVEVGEGEINTEIIETLPHS